MGLPQHLVNVVDLHRSQLKLASPLRPASACAPSGALSEPASSDVLASPPVPSLVLFASELELPSGSGGLPSAVVVAPSVLVPESLAPTGRAGSR
jgi:hypothetical protein